MKKVILGLSAVCGVLMSALPVSANDLMVASAMQRCTSNEECALVTNSCSDNCGFVPVNKLNLATLQQTYQQRCGKAMEANPQCNINPPISAACINSRCTIDYAYKNNADAKDYKAGAYPVPEAAVADKIPASAAPADDRHGFTAYGLPKQEVRQDSIGEIVTKVYVPAQAPVSGGNYVPVGNVAPAVAPAPAPKAAAPVAAPVTKPQPAPAAAMPAVAPQAQAPVPATNVYIPENRAAATPAAPPESGLAPYAPTPDSYATPTTIVPAPAATAPLATEPYATPRDPSQKPADTTAPAPAPLSAAPAPMTSEQSAANYYSNMMPAAGTPGPATAQSAAQRATTEVFHPADAIPANAVNVAAPAPVATATTTPKMIATPADPIPSNATDRIPEPRAPERAFYTQGTSPETGNANAPIPASDFKEKSLAPMPGQTVQVNPEDPGATPQNIVLQPPVAHGPNGTPTFSTKTIRNSEFN